MNRVVFQREVSTFDQKVNSFVQKYSSPSSLIAEKVLADADRLTINKSSLFTRCSLLRFSHEDDKNFKKQLNTSQEKINEVICILSNQTPFLARSQEVLDLCKLSKFQKRFQLLKNETDYFLRNSESNLDSHDARVLVSYWNDFIDQIRDLNAKSGDFIFRIMKASSDKSQALETPDCKKVIEAENKRIRLWIEADHELLKLRAQDTCLSSAK